MRSSQYCGIWIKIEIEVFSLLAQFSEIGVIDGEEPSILAEIGVIDTVTTLL